MSKNPQIGSSLDDFLKEEGLYEDATNHAVKRMLAWQVEKAMREQGITKAEMARRMGTSRAHLGQAVGPRERQGTTGHRAARCYGRRPPRSAGVSLVGSRQRRVTRSLPLLCGSSGLGRAPMITRAAPTARPRPQERQSKAWRVFVTHGHALAQTPSVLRALSARTYTLGKGLRTAPFAKKRALLCRTPPSRPV